MSTEREWEEMTLLERIDLLIAALPAGDAVRRELVELRPELAEQEGTIAEARQTIEKMEEVIKKVTSPANRIGIFLETAGKETAHIVVGGADYNCNVDPRVNLKSLKKGTRVLVNEAYAIVGDLGLEQSGPIMKIATVLEDDRLRLGSEHGSQSTVVRRSSALKQTCLKAGDEVRVDSNYRVALELIHAPEKKEHYLDFVPELPWSKVGGQEEAITAIKDAIELPLLHPELFKRFQHAVPKGFLLYGPPGCGKTLIGKATAYNLTRQLQAKSQEETREYFMHLKGPEILNMWVGESERMVREIFATAREKRREGFMPFLFIDEAESILGTRRASRYSNILSTLVPMFCAEMDGIASLNDVVIILASNRADLIDPAILRPGRIDRKIKVNRPNKDGAREIYRIYLTNDLPYDGVLGKESANLSDAIDKLVERFVDWQFVRREENKFLEVTLRSGRKEALYRSDLLSGAIIAAVVERAKAAAIKRSIQQQSEEGISEHDLHLAFNAEYLENDIFPPTDITEDWLKLVDYEAENIVRVAPARSTRRERNAGFSRII